MTRTGEAWTLDAGALSAGLHAGEISAVEIVDACLARIDARNPTLNAVVAVNPRVTELARASDVRHRSGRSLGPLDGIPVLVKDNLVTADMPTTWGSALFEARRWSDDEIPVALLRAAGAIPLGKTNVPEFTLEAVTDNPLFGVTRNPWDPRLTPGGSSGGSVAAVAAGMAPLALCTDGGGSIRRPAAYTGLYGLKPSIGRIPRGGGLPPLLLDMEVVGPVARSLGDVALVLDALARQDARDHRSLRLRPPDARRALNGPSPRALRILAVPRIGEAPVDPAMLTALSEVVGALRALGHQVDTGPLPVPVEELNERWPGIGAIGLATLRRHEPQWAGRVSGRFDALADTAGDGSALWEILTLVEAARNAAALAFEEIDVIVTPSCAAPPWPVDERWPTHIDGREVGPRGSAVYSGWVNAIGHPALTVPWFAGPAGVLPTGVQLVGAFGAESGLLSLAGALEAHGAIGFRWPPEPEPG